MSHNFKQAVPESPPLSQPLTCEVVAGCLREKPEVLRSFKVRSLLLFGSVARNEATLASDVDFLVEFEGPTTFDAYMGLKFFLEELFNCPVDLVTRKALKPIISQAVLEEAIRVA